LLDSDFVHLTSWKSIALKIVEDLEYLGIGKIGIVITSGPAEVYAGNPYDVRDRQSRVLFLGENVERTCFCFSSCNWSPREPFVDGFEI